MATKKKRFLEPQTVECSVSTVNKATPRSTRYKNRWAVRIFEEWQAQRGNQLVLSECNPFSLDISRVENLSTNLLNMSTESLNFWMIKFVQEVCDNDGDHYPGNTLYQIVCSIKRYLEENGRGECNMLDVKNYRYVVLDWCMYTQPYD